VTTRDEAGLLALAQEQGVPALRLGLVFGERVTLRAGAATLVDLPVARLHEAWMSLEALMQSGGSR
jgi:hypothetical protein